MKNYEAQILEQLLSLKAFSESDKPGIDNPIAILRDLNNNQEFDDDEVFFYTKDHLGSIRELVGFDGKLKQRQRYTAYGVTTREKNTDEMDKLIDHAHGFTGRELDSEIGMYFYRARYYSPSTGVFLSRDALGFAAGDTNLYRYVKNNPVNYIDPTGEIGVLGAITVACTVNTILSFGEAIFAANSASNQIEAFNNRIVQLRGEQKSCTSKSKRDAINEEIGILEMEKIKVINDKDLHNSFLNNSAIGGLSAFCAITSATRLF